VSAAVVSLAGARAATVYVTCDPAQNWNGYENVYTNGVSSTVWPAYYSTYLGVGTSFPNQATIDGSGNVTISPDIRMDELYPTDPLLWADTSGTSPAISDVVSDMYIDSSAVAAGGDTVVFSGSLTANTLAAPYSSTAVLFIKDYDSSYNYKGIASVPVSTLAPGQTFTVTYPGISATGDHVQWGLEWTGPPARVATVGSLGSATVSTNGANVTPPPSVVNVYIDPSWPWNGYENIYNQYGGYVTGNYFAPGNTAQVQGSISHSGVAEIAPDISESIGNPYDTTIWADASGTSPAIASVDSNFYVDETTVAGAGQTVVFSGTLVTNSLVEPYASSAVAFIKEYTSSFGFIGEVTVNLNTLTNGQSFSISTVVVNTGDHVQWGFEWQGPPVRTNLVAAAGYAILSSNSVVTTGPQILTITPATANVVAGGSQTFTANAVGTGLTYQWLKDGALLSNGAGVAGATTATLALTAMPPSAEGAYSLVATDSSNRKATNSAYAVVYNPAWLYFDPILAPFNGYINVWDSPALTSRPPSGTAGTTPPSNFGFGVSPTTLLRASMNNGVVTLQPNTYVFDGATNTMNPAYINPDGSAAAYLEQDYYVAADFLNGQTLTFAGFCPSNSLNSAYTAVAWIKDLTPSYSLEHRYDAPLVQGQPFSITVATTPGDHVQYGFALFGPANSSTNPITAGAAQATIYSPLSVTPSSPGVKLTFPTVVHRGYNLQYKTNLTDATWSSLVLTNGTGSPITVPDAGAAARRFYRFQIE